MTGILPYFPRISFFQRAVQEGKILVFPELIYDKNWQINRMIVPGSNGLINLSIPISGGRNCKVRLDQVEIDNRYHWQRDHFRTLSSVYGRSPFFIFYSADLKALMDQPYTKLLDWNNACLDWLFLKVKYEKKIAVSYASQSFETQHETIKKQVFNAVAPVEYPQVFEKNIGFQADVSILDLLFNQGVRQTLSIIGITA